MDNTAPEKFEFLVKITADYFLAEIHGHEITGTAVPSVAFHSDYRAADRICAGLRVHGYPQCYVTDATGKPVTADMLLTPPPTEPPFPLTITDLDKISASEIKRQMKRDKEFAKRIGELYSQGTP
jgi:hypothetical protein